MGGCVVSCGLLCCFFWFCLCTNNAENNCSAEIRFPSLDVSLDDDNTPITVHFEVVSECNADLSQYRLFIRTSDGSHPDLSSQQGTSLCSIRSVEPSNSCDGQCNKTAGGLSCRATETFPRRPHRTWRVEGNNKIIAKIAVFNVSYPTNFTYFDIPALPNGRENKPYQVEKKGYNYEFQCRWEEGNPLRQIVLRGPGNKVLKSTTSASPGRSTLLRHTITSDCSASGQYHCEVEGTRQFKNVTLLVKCPLKFNEGDKSPQRRVQTGRDATFTFNVTSYTTDFTSCQLTTPSGTPVNCEGNAKREVTVRGSPPNFDVIVTVEDVTEKEHGTWTLTVANGEGDDKVSFGLSVTRPVTTPQAQPTVLTVTDVTEEDDRPPEVDVLSHPGVVVAMCVACDLVLVAVVIICLWRRQWKLPCAETPALAAPSAQPVTTSDDDVDAASRGFVEPDSPDYVEPDSPERKTSSNDYLEPIPSADEYLEPTARREEPAGPYESLQMADVGVRSIYSEITPLGRPRLA